MSSFTSDVSLSLIVTNGKYLSEYEYVRLWPKCLELILLAGEEGLLFYTECWNHFEMEDTSNIVRSRIGKG